MRTVRYAVQNPAAAHACDQAGLGCWVRSMSFIDMRSSRSFSSISTTRTSCSTSVLANRLCRPAGM
jgi:hypothetical protein